MRTPYTLTCIHPCSVHSSYDVARKTVLLLREICSKTKWSTAKWVCLYLEHVCTTFIHVLYRHCMGPLYTNCISDVHLTSSLHHNVTRPKWVDPNLRPVHLIHALWVCAGHNACTCSTSIYIHLLTPSCCRHSIIHICILYRELVDRIRVEGKKLKLAQPSGME